MYYNEDYRMRPGMVDIFDHVNVCMIEVLAGDLVGVSMVVAAHLDEYQVGGLFGVDVPCLGLVAVEFVCTATGVGCLVPVPCLCDNER